MSTQRLSDNHDLRSIIEGYFGKHTTEHWEMNSVLIEFVSHMRAAEQTCSTVLAECRSHLPPKDSTEEAKN